MMVYHHLGVVFSLFLYLLDILFRTSLKLVRVYSTIPAGVTIKSHTHTSENPSKFCVLLFSPPSKELVAGLD
jgi:hypothetical protein